MPLDHIAVDSTLGYAFQALHALVVLLRAGDDEAVSVELTDDIALHHAPATLDSFDITRFQVSHSLKTSLPEITVASSKLWRTLRIWAAEYNSKERYFLLTCAAVNSELQALASPIDDRKAVQVALENEAERVIEEVAQNVRSHKDRIEGCRAFVALSPTDRAQLLRQMMISADSPNILEIDSILDRELRNIARPEKRKTIIQRLRGYWMNRVCISLTGQLPKVIKKSELLQCLEDLANELVGDGLSYEFDAAIPLDSEHPPNIMRRQIELVNGGGNRLERSKLSHWKSRNQRQKWLENDVSMTSRLDDFDQKLVEAWHDLHGPMCDDTSSATDKEKQLKGREILDWSHNDAPQRPFRLGPSSIPRYVTQGSYQDLANQLRVGWHPEYKTLLSKPGDEE